jgi:hypothetical protein
MTLTRTAHESSGIYGVIESGAILRLCTLEHSYDNKAKIPAGNYTCKRSLHKLHSTTEPFETFQVMDVPGHDNILFHWGNYNKDSEGCVLLGKARQGDMIVLSKDAWQEFMRVLNGQDDFKLTVLD